MVLETDKVEVSKIYEQILKHAEKFQMIWTPSNTIFTVTTQFSQITPKKTCKLTIPLAVKFFHVIFFKHN